MEALAPALATAPRRRLRERLLGEHPTAWAFIAPAVVIILGLTIVPVVWSLLLSFRSSDLISPSHSVGLANYKALVHDPALGAAVKHTLIFTVFYVPLSIAAGLGLALALDRRIRLIGLYRTLILVPFIVATAVQGVLFSFIFDQRFGVVNSLLQKLGLPTQGFLGDPGQALYIIILIALWGSIGFCVIIYLAALQDVPKELKEAAAVDGATRWEVLRHVTIPQLAPITVFLLVWQTLFALQLFDLVYATTRGGPLESTVVIVYYIYLQAFQLFHAGYAAAIAYVVALVLIGLSALQIIYRRWRVAHP
ncbi:MAG: sugar ABC transporter permease [Actinobacteria bacterium]|nr:sugar ABC transporter permease [Actinomycetota bacterium]